MDEKLSEILKEGEIIRTRHCQAYNWITNIVLGIDEKCIEIDIGIEKEYIDNIVMIGDTMNCKYTSKEREYMLVGWVSDVKPDFPQKLTIRIHNVYSYPNKREAYRYDVYLCSVIKKDKDEKRGVFAIMTNISLGGAAFTTRKDIGDEFSNPEVEKNNLIFDVFVSNTIQISFEGSIKRKTQTSKGIEYGIMIEKINYEDEENLYKYISSLENKDKEFHKNKQSYWNKNSKYFKDDK